MKTATPIAFTFTETEFVELSAIERFEDGSGYVSMIRVGSGEFACSGRKFFFAGLPGFLKNLKKGYQELRGHAELRTQYEEEFVRFEFTSRGHVVVTGLLRDYGNLDRKLQFGFEADQSFVPPLIASIERVTAELK
jgi:hypothetical protein